MTKTQVLGTTGLNVVTDAAGNITNDGLNTFTYDDKGRMASSTNSASLITIYQVNALGQRVSKTNSGGTTYFVYDEQGVLMGTYDVSGSATEELVYLESRPVATVRGATTYRILTDHLQTPRKLIDASNATVWSWDGHEAFGKTGPTGSVVFNLRFPGQYADVETGLFNNGFRDYAPAWGRYVESDPTGLGGGLNTYGYVGGNPSGLSDNLGLYKVNWVPPTDSKAFLAAVTWQDNPNQFIIWAHGDLSDEKIEDGDFLYSADVLAKYIKNNPNFHPGMDVVIMACDLATPDRKGFVFDQEVADLTGANVIAPNGVVTFGLLFPVMQVNSKYQNENNTYMTILNSSTPDNLVNSPNAVLADPAWTSFKPNPNTIWPISSEANK